MRTASHILDFQLYPFWVRWACETIAEAASLASNFVVQVALSLKQPKAIATFWVFLTFGLISVAASAFIGYFAQFAEIQFYRFAHFVRSTMRRIKYWRAKRRDEPKLTRSLGGKLCIEEELECKCLICYVESQL